MATHVALLRGINLGGRKKVAMADLRELMASLGHTDVATYIQSGNVVFSTDGQEHRARSRRDSRRRSRTGWACGPRSWC